MSTPRFLIGLALLFWGFQTGIIWLAVAMALLLELPFWITARWEFEYRDYCRVWDLCGFLFLGAAFYSVLSRDTTNDLMEFLQAANYTARNRVMNQALQSAFYFLQWWPLIFFPLALAQAYGQGGDLPLAVYSWTYRRKLKQSGELDQPHFNFGWVYFATILFSAAATNHRESWFYLEFAGLSAYALWYIRPRRMHLVMWVALMLLVGKLGFWGHQGIAGLQELVEGRFSAWISSFMRQTGDSRESRTAIGRVGQLKLSGKIVWRLTTEGKVPTLVREASYDNYRDSVWRASSGETDSVISFDTTTWPMQPPRPNSERVFLEGYIAQKKGLLEVPMGAVELESLPVGSVKTNHYGAIRIEDSPPFVRYGVTYGPGRSIDYNPNPVMDFSIPDAESNAVAQAVGQLSLAGKTTAQKAKVIDDFFLNHFYYSTWQSMADTTGTNARLSAVSRFLLNTHKGHCEYFATATVLMLRKAGIPARYAVGFSVQEPAGQGKFILRERHAHAWCIYYDNQLKTWVDLDTTPGNWLAAEERENKSAFEPLSDLWSSVQYQVSRWRWLGDRGELRQYLLLLVLGLAAFLAWRIFARRRRARPKADNAASAGAWIPVGLDSEFYQVEQRLSREGLARLPGETLSRWLHRIETASPWPTRPLLPLLVLHYRYRFDPLGLTPDERTQLQREIGNWLKGAREERSS